jgi:aspartate/methionine/tyrosine aminotransferase
MNVYYNFPFSNEIIKNEIIPCYGSTDGFVMLLDTLKQKFKQANFIFPETSFLANTKIAESYDFKSIKINKPAEDNFFISKEQIDELYKNNYNQNIFYFTSV